MTFFTGLLTFVLVLDCLVLIFLVLLQLPKKEAGAGLAFGGAATDALFGAGSGNMLTKITRNATILFFALALVLGILQSGASKRSVSDFQRELDKAARQPSTTTTAAQPPAEAPAPAAAPASTNVFAPPAPSAPPPAVAPPVTNLLTTPPAKSPGPTN